VCEGDRERNKRHRGGQRQTVSEREKAKERERNLVKVSAKNRHRNVTVNVTVPKLWNTQQETAQNKHRLHARTPSMVKRHEMQSEMHQRVALWGFHGFRHLRSKILKESLVVVSVTSQQLALPSVANDQELQHI
jgi:hypothetical protein